MTSCTKKYARKVRLYSVRTRNQITSFAMTANSKNSENSKHHQLSSKWIFLYPRHNWSDLLFLFILIVFYYYVLLDVYPPRNFIYILVFPVNSINNEIIGTILIHGQGPWQRVLHWKNFLPFFERESQFYPLFFDWPFYPLSIFIVWNVWIKW